MSQDTDTKHKILSAAVHVFAAKGKAGARIQEIADLAEVNKAMIYYYYASKDNLYKQVIDLVVVETFKEISRLAATDTAPEQKVRQIIDAYVDLYVHRHDLFQLLLREVMSGETLRKSILSYKDVLRQQPDQLPARVIQQGIDEGVFRPLDPEHTFMSLMGITIIYAIGRPIANAIMGIEDKDLELFLEERRQHVTDLLLNGLLVKQS